MPTTTSGLIGYRAEELLGEPIPELIAPGDQPELDARLAVAARTGPIPIAAGTWSADQVSGARWSGPRCASTMPSAATLVCCLALCGRHPSRRREPAFDPKRLPAQGVMSARYAANSDIFASPSSRTIAKTPASTPRTLSRRSSARLELQTFAVDYVERFGLVVSPNYGEGSGEPLACC